MFKRKGGGGSKAFWTMLKKTALFLRDGFPNQKNKSGTLFLFYPIILWDCQVEVTVWHEEQVVNCFFGVFCKVPVAASLGCRLLVFDLREMQKQSQNTKKTQNTKKNLIKNSKPGRFAGPRGKILSRRPIKPSVRTLGLPRRRTSSFSPWIG